VKEQNKIIFQKASQTKPRKQQTKVVTEEKSTHDTYLHTFTHFTFASSCSANTYLNTTHDASHSEEQKQHSYPPRRCWDSLAAQGGFQEP